jgi:hypothetical protein
MGTPIWDEVNSNIRTIQKSAYERGRIEQRTATVQELKKIKRPATWVTKLIERLERGEIG